MILVSACLAGIPCRWDGESKGIPAIIALVREGEAIPVCPEQLGGLSTPREPSELCDGRVWSRTGSDVTGQFAKGAEITLEIARRFGCQEAILKARSPSCGKGLVYDGTFSGRLVRGNGITVQRLLDAGIAVRTEEDISLSIH
ncbi:MAG: DUF523 domain-containing protein [Spirochaetaceae bacterium]|nr:DUF523 domain-containing protein [Spirochaetaceae bacterium]